MDTLYNESDNISMRIYDYDIWFKYSNEIS